MNALSRAWWGWIAIFSVFLCGLAWPAWGQVSTPGRLRIAFVSHAPNSDTWWTVIKNALKDAEEDFNISVDYLNPPDGSIDGMAKLIEGLDAQQYDGVVSTIADFDRLREPLSQLKTRHLPLITVNTGDEEASKAVGALFHVGQSDYEAGARAGERAAGLGARRFFCLNHYPENRGSFERCKGFAQGMGLAYDQKTMVLELRGSAAQMAEQVRLRAESVKPTDFWLALGPTSADAMLTATSASKSGAEDPLPPMMGTFDLSPSIAKAIREKKMAFAVDQQPYAQGYLATGLLAGYVRLAEPRNPRIALFGLYTQSKLHARMSRYGIELKAGSRHFVNSGPGFIVPINLGKVEHYSGSFR